MADDVLEFLRGLDLFKELGPEQTAKFAAILRPVEYDEGEVIFHEKSEGQHVFIVRTGVVEIYRTIEGQERHTRLARLSPGEIFGELSLLDGRPRSAGARATIDPTSTLLVASKRDFEKLLEENPGLATRFYRALIRKLGDRLRRLDDAVHDLSRAMSYGWY